MWLVPAAIAPGKVTVTTWPVFVHVAAVDAPTLHVGDANV
jgi:hypothetical protein